MKPKRLRRLLQQLRESEPLPSVTFRTLSVCFSDRTVSIDGRRIQVEADCVTIPILSGDAMFMPRGDMERIA